MLYLAAFGLVFVVNLMPAFGPPTWALLVLMRLNWHLNPVALVALGALAAGTGRYLLGLASYRLRNRLSERRRTNLQAAQTYLLAHRSGAVLGLGLFALSPLPSAQLFEAAGVLALPLLPLTVAFFAGRLVSYSLYIGAASVAERSLGSTLLATLTSPAGIAVQVLLVLIVVLLARLDWVKIVQRRTGAPAHRGSRAESRCGHLLARRRQVSGTDGEGGGRRKDVRHPRRRRRLRRLAADRGKVRTEEPEPQADEE